MSDRHCPAMLQVTPWMAGSAPTATVAVDNSVLTIIWHFLVDAKVHCQDLEPDYYQSKIDARRRERELVRQLERLTGKKVTLEPATAA